MAKEDDIMKKQVESELCVKPIDLVFSDKPKVGKGIYDGPLSSRPVALLSDEPPTKDDIARAHELLSAKYGWDEES